MTAQTALIYRRISTEDQSNWSLSGQERTAREYCERRGVVVLGVFGDEQSGSNFDRPGWQQMVAAVKRQKPTFVVCAKYDRISRNAGEALQLIQSIEEKHGVRFVSAMEEIPVNPHSPFFFQMRAQMLVNANVELLVIRDRTAKGRHDAARSGRFTAPAPFGYDNARDDDNKPILRINEQEAATVRWMFDAYLSGQNFADIRRQARDMGFRSNHKSAVQRLLSNPIYAGFVVVPAYAGQSATMTKAQHLPIVPPEMFWRVQNQIAGGTPKTRQPDEDVPLRGLLLCDTCGQPLTSSVSRGNGGKYHYYFCHRHTGPSFRVDHVHDNLATVLRGLSFGQRELDTLRHLAENTMRQLLRDSKKELDHARQQLQEVSRRIDALELKLLDNVVNEEVFRKWEPTLEAERADLTAKIEQLETGDAEVWASFHDNLHLLGSIQHAYEQAEAKTKRKMLGLIFGGTLTLTAKGFRTKQVTPLLLENALKINTLEVEKKMGQTPDGGESPICTPYGTVLEPVLEFFRLAKTA